MRSLLELCGGLICALLCASCTSGGSLPYDPANPPAATSVFSLPGQFAKAQGNRGWYYYQVAPGSQAYETLAWGAAPADTGHNLLECWRVGEAPAALIAERKLHPTADRDVVIAWRAVKAGQAQISLTMQSYEADDAGDGVAVTIWHNATRVNEPAILTNEMGQSHTISSLRTVKTGDILYLRVNGQANATHDWYTYAVEIVVQ